MFLYSYDVGNCHVIPEMLNVVLHILFSLIVHNNILYQILRYTTANLQKVTNLIKNNCTTIAEYCCN